MCGWKQKSERREGVLHAAGFKEVEGATGQEM